MAVAEDNELEIHVLCALLYDFKAGLKACESHQRIKEAFGEIVGESTVRRWFHKFKEGDFELNGKQRSGRPTSLDDEELLQIIEADPRQTTRELAERLDVDHSTIVRHLRSLGKVSKLGSWTPHELSRTNRLMRVDVAAALLSRKREHSWMRDVTTGD